ncbi:hypothetical protein DITRI_Ditri14bG0136600 [Diplodiscus trichospermus]
MEDGHKFSRQGSGVWRSLRDGDFEEEDVWAVLKETKRSTSMVGQSTESYFPVRRNLPSAARMIPRSFSATSNDSYNIGSSSSCSSHEANRVKQQSAPVNIPDWSKISSKNSKKASSRNGSRHDDDDDLDDDGDGVMNGFGHDEYEDDDDEYNSKVPPHEFLARRLARSQISSFSVFEGVGRKLKGRDLRKVRNAVLTKTGFLE